MTSVHGAGDVRIFHKECRSLSNAGYEVVLIVPGKDDGVSGGVQLLSVPVLSSRFRRMAQTVWHVYRRALQCRADIYHFHDPELLPAGLLLKLGGKRVVYDAHEDLPRQMLSKPWIPSWTREFLAKVAECLETWAAGRLDAVVTVTPTIARRFPPGKTVVIHNYPRVEEFPSHDLSSYLARPVAVAYVGAITSIRGIREVMKAMSLLPESLQARLTVAGSFSPLELEMQSQSFPGCNRTDFVGHLSRQGIIQLLSEVRVGLVTLHPTPNYRDSLPIKLFEYMAAGLPVIASDFPLWREIVNSSKCGLLVDPLNPRAIADSIQWLLEHADEAAEMGRRGREAVLTRYNWETEAARLIEMYRKLLGGPPALKEGAPCSTTHDRLSTIG